MDAPHLSPPQRAALGRQARKVCPRSTHALLERSSLGRDAFGLIESQNLTRLPELVPLRYQRMAASAFAFFRGAALVMATDLAETPVSGLTAQICGDAHLSNFGVFGTPERRLIFDINDFDETDPGPWEWDVKRLAASVAVAARENGFKEKERRKAVRETVRRYREAMRELSTAGNLAVWYASADADEIQRQYEFGKAVKASIAKSLRNARSRDNVQAFGKLTEQVSGSRRLVSRPPTLVPVRELLPDLQRQELEARMRDLLDGYRATLSKDRQRLLIGFRFVDLARSVSGIGSVGTRGWTVLLVGRDDDDPLVLQVKEAGRSVLAGFAGPETYPNQGERVVEGQRLMQAASDIFLGWQQVRDRDGATRDYYVRQLRDWKGSAAVDRMDPDTLGRYGRLCGWTLARAHARSGDRIAIASYLGSGDSFDTAVADFAEAYDEQNERDYRHFLDASRALRHA